MNNSNNPLGQYATAGAFIAAVGVLVASIMLHVLYAVNVAHNTDAFLDQLAFAAFGVLVGLGGANVMATQQAANKVNGLQKEVDAAHTRLDKAGAPAANAAEGEIHYRHDMVEPTSEA